MQFQFITHFNDKHTYYDGALLALKGGCRWVQLRMKNSTAEEREETALRVQALCKQYEATFIIDDDVELVRKIHADGVHLGKKDMPIREARKILGHSYIIGGTANTFEDVKAHYTDGAEYVGCGPFRFTTTKKGLSPVLGLEGYQSIIARMRKEGIQIPLYAIGGITYEDLPQLMSAGVDGVALSGTILNAEDPIEETKRIIHI
ncbi:MAG: thiamine phosphate synthase [Bacteroides sp.]|nr:thiamine phosphate synthase [Roseburia sp.]MCM1346441.1 thiamine phosphate synthase [Bacteroides sp.]MCM1421726.1 thiamine phosphate synthase [Bacteroides sp.]